MCKEEKAMYEIERIALYEEFRRRPAALLQETAGLESHSYNNWSLNFKSTLFSTTDVLTNEKLYAANIVINNHYFAYLDGDEFSLLKQAVTMYQGSSQEMIFSCRSIRLLFSFYRNTDHIVLFGDYSKPYNPTRHETTLISFTSANLLTYLDKFLAKMI
jgi:hypothetical protein